VVEVLVRSLAGMTHQITARAHELLVDEPLPVGTDQGPTPYELLLAALGACTAMTVQWSAQKHRIALERVEVRLTQSRTATGHLFRCSVILAGDLSEKDRAQLQHAAEACPVARTLTHEIAIETRVTLG